MKRFLPLFALLLLISSSSWAQHNRALALSLSFNPTLNWLSVSGSDAEKSQVGAGFDYGLNADFFINHNDRYAITTGLLVSNMHGKVNYAPDHAYSIGGQAYAAGEKLTVDYRLKYLEVPLAFRLRSKQFNRSSLWGQFGLFTGWNVSAKASSNDKKLKKENIGNEVRLFNMGLNVGLGFEYDLGENNAISLGLVYKNGFFNTMKHNLGENTTTKTLALQLSFVF